MDCGDINSIVSPKPCKTPNSSKIRKFNFQNEIAKSEKVYKNDNYNPDNLCILESNNEKPKNPTFRNFKNFNDFLELSENFDKKVEEDIVNNELMSIIYSSSSSPNITPNNQSDFSKSFFNSINSIGSYDTLNTLNNEDQISPVTSQITPIDQSNQTTHTHQISQIHHTNQTNQVGYISHINQTRTCNVPVPKRPKNPFFKNLENNQYFNKDASEMFVFLDELSKSKTSDFKFSSSLMAKKDDFEIVDNVESNI